MKTFNQFVEAHGIKGWKNAHGDLMKHRKQQSDSAKSVYLHSLKKDGTESKMHDARKPFASEEEARRKHEMLKKLNPKSSIKHHLYVDGKLVDKLE